MTSTQNNQLNGTQLSNELFVDFSKFIYDQCGIQVGQRKKTLLSNRLRKRLRSLSLNSFEQYWNYLQDPLQNKNEMRFFFDVVTTNETFFQRGINHYQILSKRIVPQLLKKGHIKIWSAGCSSGEEAYDINMVMLDLKEIFPQLSYSILATDLSQKELEHANKGEYGDHAIGKLTPYQKNKYFDVVEPEQSSLQFAQNVLQIKPVLKQKIEFKQHNLISDNYPTGIDVIFCRNVMIYFDEVTQTEIIKKFYQSLSPNRFLFIGHSESLQIIQSPFAFKRFPEGSVYIRKEKKNAN